jgi:hypothetical protein
LFGEANDAAIMEQLECVVNFSQRHYLLILFSLGDHCETEYDVCRLNPCNGGTCVRLSVVNTNAMKNLSAVLGFKCASCPNGFEVSSDETKCVG